MAELIAAGSVSYETAMDLPPSVLVAIYEGLVRVEARGRAAATGDTAAAIAGSLGEEGHRAMRAHVGALNALANGQPLPSSPRGDAPGTSYTEDAPFL